MRNKFSLILFIYLFTVSVFATNGQENPIKIKPLAKKILNQADTTSVSEKRTLNSIPVDTQHHKVTPFKTDFRTKYLTDDDFVYRDTNSNFLERFLINLIKLIKWIFNIGVPSETGSISLYIIKLLAGIVILFFVFLGVRLFLNKGFNGIFQRKSAESDVDAYEIEKLVKFADFEKLIYDRENQGDTRQCVRLFYLWLLQKLNEENIIIWTPEKTNADYINEITNADYRQQFSYLSYLYNYIWYGEFAISTAEYLSAKDAFLSYLKKN